MSIDHINLSRIDLNLLIALDALLLERNVTRAALRVGLGQSAMSHNLARLRALFEDEILVRGPDGMHHTPRALMLAGPVRVALAQIQATVLDRGGFDPGRSSRTFRISIPDSLEAALVPSLIIHLRQAAPNVRLQLRSTPPSEVPRLLDDDELDVGISQFTKGADHHRQRHLYHDDFLCVFNSALLGLEPPISLQDYVRLPHVLGSLRGDSRGIVDDALAKLNLERMVVLATPHFISVPFILKKAPVISTLSTKLARYFETAFGLAASPLPFELAGFDVSLLWHSSYDRDPAHMWLRETLVQVATNTSMEL